MCCRTLEWPDARVYQLGGATCNHRNLFVSVHATTLDAGSNLLWRLIERVYEGISSSIFSQMNVQATLRVRFVCLWRLTERGTGGILFPLLPNRNQARDDVTCHTRHQARGLARIGCKHCHPHQPSCQGTTPRCSTFTFLLRRLITIDKSFFLACTIFLTIAPARSSSLGEPQWRESFFRRLRNCFVNS